MGHDARRAPGGSLLSRMAGAAKGGRERVDWARYDRELVARFEGPDEPSEADYEFAFQYFITGFLAYRSADGAHATYPGAPSKNGRQCDALEGFSRICPLIAVWLASGRARRITTLAGAQVDLADLLSEGLINGTAPGRTSYWGDIGDLDQRIVEASDVALCLWVIRDSLWRDLPSEARQAALAWLRQSVGRKVPDNNWHLIVVFTALALEALGGAIDRDVVEAHYVRFKAFYRGGGWYSDGSAGPVDFYNPWQMHYLLSWILRLAPDFDSQFIRRTSREFLATYRYFVSTEGLPIFGRSICYRLGAVAPLVSAAQLAPDIIPPGQARRYLDSVWKHFLPRGAVRHGTVTQGYYGVDLRLLDNYSGAASPLCSLRSIIEALHLPRHGPFWVDTALPLPIEMSDYVVDVPEVGIVIEGHRDLREVLLRMPGNCGGAFRIRPYSLWRRLGGKLLGRPIRPENHEAKYCRKEYSSRWPLFAADTPRNKVQP